MLWRWWSAAAGVVGLGASTYNAVAPAVPGEQHRLVDLAGSAVTLGAVAAAGAVLVGIRPARRIGGLFVVTATTWAVSEITWALSGLVEHRTATAATALRVLSQSLWPIMVLPLTTLLPLLFPDGRLLSRHWRWAVVTSAAAAGLLVLSSVTAPSYEVDLDTSAPNPWGVVPVSAIAAAGGQATWSLAATAGMAALVLRWRRGAAPVRQRIGLVTATTTTIVVVSLQPWLPAPVAAATGAATPLVLVVAVTVSIWRQQLWDVRLVVRHVAVHAVVVAVLVLVYSGLVAVMGLAVRPLPGPVVPVLAAVVTAVVFEPGRRAAQAALRRRLFGARDDPLGALVRVREQVERAPGTEAMLSRAVSAVAAAVRSPHVQVVLHQDGTRVVAASSGAAPPEPDEAAVRLSLVHSGEELGFLEVAGRTPGEVWSRADRRLLDQLAHHVGVALASSRQEEELSAARQGAVAAAAEERARVAHDLHDLLGPMLSGARLATAALALELEPASPQLATVGEVEEALARAASQLRRIIDGLGPAALDGAGLLEALHDHLPHVGATSRPAITLDADLDADLGALPAAVTQAAYPIVVEAVANAVRHAAAQRIDVRLRMAGGHLVVVVDDDGCGRPPYVAGVGTRSMRQRTAALGGTFDLRARAGGGTRVSADLPLGDPAVPAHPVGAPVLAPAGRTVQEGAGT